MVTILPPERSAFDVIGKAIGQNIQQNFPGAVQQGFQRQTGLNSIDQLQKDIAAAGGDVTKMLPGLLRAYTLNPALERSGIGQLLINQARAANAFPPSGGQPSSGQPMAQPGQSQSLVPGLPGEEIQPSERTGIAQQPSNFATPSPFNVFTNDAINAEASRYANALQDPNAFAARQAQLLTQNQNAQAIRNSLEESALNSGVKPGDLPRFMLVGSKYDPSNPNEWLQNAKREYSKVRANDEKLQKAFLPGLGSGLLGIDRQPFLDRIRPAVQDQVRAGLEQETRDFLAKNYVTPTEIGELIYPIKPEQEKALEQFPKGVFPAQIAGEPTQFGRKARPKTPFISYEEALERAPKELQTMQDQLADFFKKNVDPTTSLLALEYKLWKDKDYDWRQIGPAIRQAERMGLRLTPQQSTEMTDVETQAPQQSLPELFQEPSRIMKYLRGGK